MSNDIIHELEMDLSREKEKIFFEKYKNIILSVSAIILLIVLGYQFYQQQKNKNLAISAADYNNFKQFYNNIDNFAVAKSDETAKYPKLLPKTVNSVPSYLPMSYLVRFNHAQKNDAQVSDLLKITDEYIKNPQVKSLTVHDSLLKLFDLSLRIDTTDFDLLEPQILEYVKHPFAFKSIAYETLLLLSFEKKEALKSQTYLKKFQENSDEKSAYKIKMYQTHPLLQNIDTKNVAL